MGTYISNGFSIILLIVMYAFGLYTLRNLRWVMFSLVWGGIGYGLSYLLDQQAVKVELERAVMLILVLPVVQQIFVSLGVLAVVHRERFDNLVDGSVYGFASGLGYAVGKAFEFSLTNVENNNLAGSLQTLSTVLVLATASGIVGVVMTQFYFRHSQIVW